MKLINQLKALVFDDVSIEAKAARYGQMLLRILYASVRDISHGQLTLRAMSLSFTTLLSMVPLLALSFSVLKGFGVHNQLEPMLQDFLTPMGEGGLEISNNIISFVENMNVGVLGSAGLVLLLFTVISLVKKVEDAFNYIWSVHQPRGIAERFRDYLSIILLGPLLNVAAVGISSSVEHSSLFQELHQLSALGSLMLFSMSLMPKIIAVAAFTFIYAFIPNTRVNWRAAFIGALVASLLWMVAGWGFTTFVASSTKYTAIYSGFAVLIIFLIWINMNWLFVLVGANISYYAQHPQHCLVVRGKIKPSIVVKERVALQMMTCIARDHREGETSWTEEKFAKTFGVPIEVISDVLTALIKAGLVVEAIAGTSAGAAKQIVGSFLPGRSYEQILLSEIYDVVRVYGDDYSDVSVYEPAINELKEKLDLSLRNALAGKTLADLV